MTYKSEHKRGASGTLNLYFHDEAPSIGAGWRKVHFKVGTNKVRIRSISRTRWTLIPRPVFDSLVKASRVIASKRDNRADLPILKKALKEFFG